MSNERDELPRSKPIRPVDETFEEDLRERRDNGPPPLPKKPGFGFWMTGVWCLLYLLVMQVVVGLGAVIVGVIILLVWVGPKELDGMTAQTLMNHPFMNKIMIAALIASHVGGALFSILILRITQGKKWYRVIALNRLPSRAHIALVSIGFPALIAFASFLEPYVMRHVYSMKDVIEGAGIEEFLQTITTWPLSLAIFTIAVLPGIGEELWCRGFLGQGTAKRYGILWSILITSFYFGLIHMEPPQAILAGLLGFFIHLSYAATRSLWTCIALHMANNTCSVLQVQGYTFINPLTHALESTPWLVLISSLLLLATVGYALYQTRCRLTPTDPNLPVYEPKGVDGVEIPPPNSGTIVTHEPLSARSALFVLAATILFGGLLAWSQQLAVAG
jgi:membrane protease YdiL (CAAX protease family)